ncbi:MAG TPA: alkaline phosphatase family protein, partial [bacterium]|nr:alkaline phosphatase family protein [bacterium]
MAILALLVGAPTSAAVPDLQTATPIKHLVVIFDENNSFDHYFGTYPKADNPPGEPPFVARPDTPAVNGLTPGLLTHNPNAAAPFRLGRSMAHTCDNDNHYRDEQQAYNAGLLDGFAGLSAQDTGCTPNLSMGYYDGNTVTALWNYAQQFAMSDNSYGTTFGPSAPGAINLVSGDTGNVDVTGCTGLAASPPTAAGCTHIASKLNPTASANGNTSSVSIATSTSPNADVTLDGLGGLSLTSDAQGFYDD